MGSGVFDVGVDGMEVIAENNWWGRATGPLFDVINGGTFDYEPFLKTQPGGPLPPFESQAGKRSTREHISSLNALKNGYFNRKIEDSFIRR